jgi:nascent polypeptide-associated complex subunit alpha
MTSAERKARKAFESIGLKEQPGFKRIIINYGRQAAIEIASPSVHRLPATDYWVIFGNAIPVDLSRSSEAAKQFSLGGASPSGAGAVPPAVAEALAAAGDADAAEAAAATASAPAASPAGAASDDVDLSKLPEGIVEKDVDFVAEHAGVTRAQAVEALIEHKQVVPAAMSFGEASA